MLRLYLDENISLLVAQALQQRGLDAISAQEAGRAGQAISDIEQLDYATRQQRILVTEDRDFIQIASTQLPHTGVIPMQRPMTVGQTIEYLELAATYYEPEEMRDSLVWCDW